MATLEERIALRELELKIERREQELGEETSAGGAFGTKAGVQLGDNLLALPQFIGKAPAHIAAAVQGLVGSSGDPGMLLGGDFDFQRRLDKQDRPFLAEAAFNTPAPKVSDVAGVVGAVKGDGFSETKMSFEEQMARMQEQHPTASLGGEVLGDIATLVGGRSAANVGGRMRQMERAVAERLGRGATDMTFGNVAIRAVDTGTKAVLKEIATSSSVKALARGAGRSLETGLEAVSLDILHGDDPLETAVYAMAGQAVGSTFLTGLQHAVRGGFGTAALNIGAASFAAGSLWQIVKDMTPGGRDSIIDSVEAGYEKVMIALMLGGISGMMGGGRIRGDGVVAEQMPRWADAITAIPRTGFISLLEDLVNAQPETERNVETALQRLAASPGELSKDLSEKLDAALKSGKFVEVVDELSEKNEEFRNWLNEE